MQTLFQTTRFEPLAPTPVKLGGSPTDQQPSGLLGSRKIIFFSEVPIW
jgi:hypothetical protein